MAETSVTQHNAFYSYNAQHAPLFAVCPGVPAENALEQASNILTSAREIIHAAAVEANSEPIYGSMHLIDMALAVIDSVREGLPSSDQAEAVGGAA